MGCSTSKLDDEEVVKLCKDRKNFIKEAVENRTKFSAGHLAYIHAMKRVSIALREYIEGDDPREFSFEGFTPPPIKKKNANPNFISISPIALSVKPEKRNPSYRINYYKSGGGSNSQVFEERPPQSPETYRVDAYSHFGMENVFQYSPANNRRVSYPPPSPQRASQWDFFWNPFSSLDYYGYPAVRTASNDDESDELQQVREEEGIPDLEEETEYEDIESEKEFKNAREVKFDREEVVVEDVDDSDDDEHEEDEDGDSEYESDEEENDDDRSGKEHSQVLLQPRENVRVGEITKVQSLGQLSKKETAVVEKEKKGEETPGFTVYVNKRPTSMAEVIKELEDQFLIACNSAGEVSSILEATRAQYASSSSGDLTALKMLNPITLFRSGSSRSSSTRFLIDGSISSSRDESSAGGERSGEFSEDSSAFSGSHQSTLDRLYIWEKKLYQEVKAGERIRMAYERKISQLRNQDVKGEDHSFVDKTRAAIRTLDTQIKVSIHTVESISKRIETLRDEELEPQLVELVQGLSRMWGAMAQCHQIQKRTLDEAKILLAGTTTNPSKAKKYTVMSPSEPHRLARAANNLETELRNWKNCFESWVTSQRAYARAITKWLLRCANLGPAAKSPFSPRRSSWAPTIFKVCVKWSKFLDEIRESPVLDGLDFFAAGLGSMYNSRKLREDRRYYNRDKGDGERTMEVVEAGHEFDDEDDDVMMMSAEKMAEVAIRVVCAGMSVAVTSLTEFSVSSAEGYRDLMKQWEVS